MPNNGTRIYTENGKGIDPRADVYKVLGITRRRNGYDHGYACTNTHGKINPASKHKPIRFDKTAALSDAEMMGSAVDNLNGIYYGIRFTPIIGRITDLHDCMNYLPPVAGTDHSRLSDFNGYDHKAVFNPIGSLPDFFFSDIASMSVGIDYDSFVTASSTGINMDDIIKKAYSPDVTGQLANMYPCILISDLARTVYWARALSRGGEILDGDKTGYTTLRTDGTWINRWYAETREYSCRENSSITGGLAPSYGRPQAFLEAFETRLVSVFFVKEIVNSGTGIDLTVWNEVTDFSTFFPGRVWACPGATGKRVEFRRYMPKGVQVYSVSMSNGSRISVNVKCGWDNPYDTGTYTIKVHIYSSSYDFVCDVESSGTYAGLSQSNPTDTNGFFRILKAYTLAELGLLTAPALNTVFEYTWEVLYNGRKTNSGYGGFRYGVADVDFKPIE